MLEIPCSYQGGKSRLAKQIVDVMFSDNEWIDHQTKFFDLFCGSGAVSIELMNRGVSPSQITMVDKGCFGAFWKAVSTNTFSMDVFKSEIDNLPEVEGIPGYLKDLSNKPVDPEKMIYHYLLLQAGAFGSKQIWIENGKWKNNSFRSFWEPTENSNRRSHVNPMMPMPDSLYKRVENICSELSGKVVAKNDYVENRLYMFDEDELKTRNAIVYCDPPYENSTKYGFSTQIYDIISGIYNNIPIYVSEQSKMEHSNKSVLLNSGRTKGNISGNVVKSPCEEWLNLF